MEVMGIVVAQQQKLKEFAGTVKVEKYLTW